jgi:hypothetical protein
MQVKKRLALYSESGGSGWCRTHTGEMSGHTHAPVLWLARQVRFSQRTDNASEKASGTLFVLAVCAQKTRKPPARFSGSK